MRFRYRLSTFWENEKYLGTPLFYMIATFLVLITACICIGLVVLPCFLTCIFNHWYWLLLWFLTIPLCIGDFALLIGILV